MARRDSVRSDDTPVEDAGTAHGQHKGSSFWPGPPYCTCMGFQVVGLTGDTMTIQRPGPPEECPVHGGAS